MVKKKALGQDPLAWISATQEKPKEKKKLRSSDSDETETPAAPSPAQQNGNGISGSFLAIYVINMLLLLLLAGLAYVDMGRRIDILAVEVRDLRQRVNMLEEHAMTFTPLPDYDRGDR